jgi:hypothetical protein
MTRLQRRFATHLVSDRQGFRTRTGNLLNRPFRLMLEATSRPRLILRVEDGFVDVGPEFLEDEGARIDADVGAPLCEGVGQGALG